MQRFRTVAAIAASLVALAGPATARAADQLTGPMASMSAMAGTWTCSTSVPAMAGRPARVDAVTLALEVVPGNALHDHITGTGYSGDDYFGYNDDAKVYWSVSDDNSGTHGSATSTDGHTFSGTDSMGPLQMSGKITYTLTGDSKLAVHEVLSVGGHDVAIDSDCHK